MPQRGPNAASLAVRYHGPEVEEQSWARLGTSATYEVMVAVQCG